MPPLPPSNGSSRVVPPSTRAIALCMGRQAQTPFGVHTLFNRCQLSSDLATVAFRLSDELSQNCSNSTCQRSLSCAYQVPPRSLAVRDSHVIPTRQTHDLRHGGSGAGSRIRFTASGRFRPTMFHRWGYRSRTVTASSRLDGACPRVFTRMPDAHRQLQA